jgi:hypothetical protein
MVVLLAESVRVYGGVWYVAIWAASNAGWFWRSYIMAVCVLVYLRKCRKFGLRRREVDWWCEDTTMEVLGF